ncbi:hypothetical protein [Porticoccus sp.]
MKRDWYIIRNVLSFYVISATRYGEFPKDKQQRWREETDVDIAGDTGLD